MKIVVIVCTGELSGSDNIFGSTIIRRPTSHTNQRCTGRVPAFCRKALVTSTIQMSCILLLLTLVDGVPFVTTWKTTTTNESVPFPLITPQTNVTIDWGDNTAPRSLVAGNTYPSPSHTYEIPGEHNVSISGEFAGAIHSLLLTNRG